jgi:hypothetical protein
MTTAYSDIPAPADLAAAEATLQANLGPLRHCRAEPTATQIAAVVVVEGIIVTAMKQQAGWARLRLKALRELGKFLLRTPYLKGRPPKVSTADTLPSLEKLDIKDRRIAWRAIQVARLDEDFFNAYLTTDEPTEKGLHREACRAAENYSESEAANVVSFDPDFGGAQSRRFTHGGYLGLATTGSEEWYTPSTIFEALGCRFDLDVASPGADIVPWIPADRHYTLTDNGLKRDWGDAFVWCNPPFTDLSQWTEKFRRHGNGIAMIGDRTSVGFWQDLCGNADLILLVNKKVNFISPNSGPGNNTLGSTLVAYGERAVQALMNAAAAGLGTLFKPYQPVLTSGEAERETHRVENYSESKTENVVPFLRQPQVWRTPPDHYKKLEAEYGPFDFDATPHPRPPGFNSLEVPWGRRTFCNGPYSARRNPEGYGPTAFARKAIQENRLGKTIVFLAPVFNYVNLLLEAGAEAHSLGRVQFEAATGRLLSAPMFITCFVLRGN